MKNSSQLKTLLIIIVILLLVGVVYYFVNSESPQTSQNQESTNEQDGHTHITATYQCDEGRNIVVSYHEDGESPEVLPGEMPVPTGSVDVSLDGNKSISLKQTISASGVRYANEDESFVFWNKGDSALIMRDNQMDLTYTNCIEV